jgi:archaellin
MFILIAVLAGGTMFGYTATHQGSLAALQLEAVANDAIDSTSHVLMVSSPVYAQDVNADGAIDDADTVAVDVRVAPGASDVALASTSVFLTTSAGRFAVGPTISSITGNGDSLLESGEVVELTFAPPAQLQAGEELSIEMTPSDGPTVMVTATMPPVIDGLMTLY